MSLATESAARTTFRLVGFLFALELVSGILQGFYVPLIPDLVDHLGIRDADFNWFEAAQLLLSALVVPILAKLGDMFGHKRILLISTVLTAGATWWLAFTGDFTSFLIAWALQGFYVVWLPLEVALIFDRGRKSGTAASATRRAAGFLVVALELGAIAGALAGGRVFTATGESVPITLIIPAIAVTLVFFAVLFGVPESEPLPNRRLDWRGFALLSLALILVTAGLAFLKLSTTAGSEWMTPTGIGLIGLGALMFIPFVRFELKQDDPAIDMRVLARPTMWPIMLTAALVGISLLGAQAPLSTFAGTDRAEVGYGLSLDSSNISYLIGAYLISLVIGAVVYPTAAKHLSPRIALIGAAILVAIGYSLFLPFHDTVPQVFTNMIIAGIGSGALVAALPSAAAAAAPRGQTGVATGLTNTTKTIGGSFASAVFAIVLAVGVTATVSSTASSLSGYLTVFAICGGGAIAAAIVLFFVPKTAFGDAVEVTEPPLP